MRHRWEGNVLRQWCSEIAYPIRRVTVFPLRWIKISNNIFSIILYVRILHGYDTNTNTNIEVMSIGIELIVLSEDVIPSCREIMHFFYS